MMVASDLSIDLDLALTTLGAWVGIIRITVPSLMSKEKAPVQDMMYDVLRGLNLHLAGLSLFFEREQKKEQRTSDLRHFLEWIARVYNRPMLMKVIDRFRPGSEKVF